MSDRRALTEIGGFRLAQVSVEVGPVRFLQTRTQTKVREFYVAPCVQQQVVRLDVSEEHRSINFDFARPRVSAAERDVEK